MYESKMNNSGLRWRKLTSLTHNDFMEITLHMEVIRCFMFVFIQLTNFNECSFISFLPPVIVHSIDEDGVERTVATWMYRIQSFRAPCVLEFDSEFDALLNSETLSGETVAKAPKVAKTKVAKTPKVKVPKDAEGPNPYGIHMRDGVVITMTYLKKFAQCATRKMVGGKGTEFSRADNINFFMSPEFLNDFQGKTTGEYAQACRRSPRWGDETYVGTPRKSKAKVEATNVQEEIILDGTLGTAEAPLY